MTTAPADLNALGLGELFATLVDARRLAALIELALDEDLGKNGDITTASFVPPDAMARAVIVARDAGVVAGLPVVSLILDERGRGIAARTRAHDGDACKRGDVLVEMAGPLATMLPLERVLLNFLGRLSGIATLARRYVEAVADFDVHVCCTRKTTPGWRELEKYAVRCGGGWIHRIGLYDAMLVKDNHVGAVAPLELADRLTSAIRAARSRFPLRFVEVEVDTLEQLDAVLALPTGLVDIVLLDNFSLVMLCEAVRRRASRSAQVVFEASGGVRLDTVRAIAETGVERISCGALTHSAASLDVAMDLLHG